MNNTVYFTNKALKYDAILQSGHVEHVSHSDHVEIDLGAVEEEHLHAAYKRNVRNEGLHHHA